MPSKYGRHGTAVAQVKDALGVKEEALPEIDPATREEIIDLTVALIGDAGSGKTNFIGTCPGPIALFDFDKGNETIKQKVLRWNSQLGEFEDRKREVELDVFVIKDNPYGKKALPQFGIYEYGMGYTQFEAKLNEIITEPLDNGTLKYKTVAFDSFTTLSTLAMNHVLLEADRPNQQPSQPNYGSLLTGLTSLFNQITALPLFKVITAHVERSKNQLNGDIEKLPLGLGSFPERMPVYIDEIFYIDINKAGIHHLITKSSSFIKQARTRKRVPDGSPADFACIERYLRGLA